MDALEEVVTPKPKVKSRATAIRSLQMLTRPLCDGAAQATTIDVIYGKNANSNPKTIPMLLRADCIDWLLSYL